LYTVLYEFHLHWHVAAQRNILGFCYCSSGG